MASAVNRWRVPAVGVRYFASDRHPEAAAGQRPQHLVRAVTGRHDERAREQLAAVGDDAERLAVGHDRVRLHALDDAHPALGERARERARRGGDVDDPALDVQVRDVGVEVGEPPAQRLGVEGLGLQPKARQRLEAQPRVGAVQIGRHRALAEVQAAAAHEHARAGRPLEVAPALERLVRETGVRRVQVVVAEGARATVRRGGRVADPPPLEHDHPRRPLRGVIGGEEAHHAPTDDHEIARPLVRVEAAVRRQRLDDRRRWQVSSRLVRGV
jgi:hypothetical protein